MKSFMNKILAGLTVIFSLPAFSGNANAYTSNKAVELRDSILRNISGATIPAKTVSILDFGAKGNGISDCRQAFAKAMKEGEKYGGVHIIVCDRLQFR